MLYNVIYSRTFYDLLCVTWLYDHDCDKCYAFVTCMTVTLSSKSKIKNKKKKRNSKDKIKEKRNKIKSSLSFTTLTTFWSCDHMVYKWHNKYVRQDHSGKSTLLSSS